MERFLLVLISLTFLAKGQLKAADSEELKTIQEASELTAKNLKSGMGVGNFTLSERASANDPWIVKTSAIISASFKGEKYYVDLMFKPLPGSYVRRIIIYDGESISTARFSPRIKPYGAEAEIFDSSLDGLHIPRLTELNWDVAKLPLHALSIDVISKKLGKEAIVLTRTDSGDVRGEYVLSKKVKCAFTCAREYDYNVAEISAWNEGVASPAQQYKVKWKRDKKVWYVSEISDEMTTLDGKQVRSELKYDRFEPNANIDPALFEHPSLELPAKARTLDRRKTK